MHAPMCNINNYYQCTSYIHVSSKNDPLAAHDIIFFPAHYAQYFAPSYLLCSRFCSKFSYVLNSDIMHNITS